MKPTNLLKSSLGTTVHCDKCCVDDHGPDNLISEDVGARQRGILLEHFIRPPVDIDFELACACDLACIKLNLVKGSRAVQRFQVWIQYSGDCNWSRATTEFNPGPILILQCGNVLPRYLSVEHRQEYKVIRSIYGISKLRLTILGMKDCVAVSLAGCEAIGVPSARVPKDCAIFSKFNLGQSQTATKVRKPALSSSVPKDSESIKRKRTIDESSIPEEFLDPITYSVMTIPVALPSGNAVDQSTLDKHVANENRWGRPASDPFTGVALASKPIVITELKSRIDHFLSSTGSTSGVRLADGRNISRSDTSCLVSEKTVDKQTAAGRVTLSTNRDTALTEVWTTATKILRVDDSADKSDCSICELGEVNYKRACGHYLCRLCVATNAESKCTICGVPSTRSSIVKVHAQ